MAGGASEMRSTRTWSPISSVFTIEAEGISKFWETKVITKRPMANTLQIEASDSSGVSVCCFSSVSTAFVVDSIVLVKMLVSRSRLSVYQPQPA